MRDLGYDLASAIADLIDNSISAQATQVGVETHFEGDASWIRITDNGFGMTEATLQEAMRFGSRRDYAAHDLGRFGLGLKAASLSQCRRLTIATRSTTSGRVRIARWDLDEVAETDQWEVSRPSVREVGLAAAPLRGRTGTVVLWEDLDRVFRYKSTDGQWARGDFNRVGEQVAAHLSMVFHRFLAGESKRRLPFAIALNGTRLKPWDPYARSEPATLRLPIQRLRLVQDGMRQVVVVRPFVLPTESRFSNSAEHHVAAGPRLWNRQQGFYVYRADRMIQSGGWSRLRTSDEHTKLARVSIDLPSGSEESFELNVSKTQVRIPASLRPQLAAVASTVTRLAQDVYRTPTQCATGAAPSAVVADPRVRAVTALVRMVVSATEDLVNRELDGSGPARQRIARRLRAMEAKFSQELEAVASREASAASRAGGRLAIEAAPSG
jgi:hypothetical protein